VNGYTAIVRPMSGVSTHRYPTPGEIGIRIPRDLVVDRFYAGFDHGLKGGHLDRIEYFRRSFRIGYRASKFYLREVRRRRGVLQFPARYRFRQRSYWPDA
jgi:hypothetical protein